MLRNCCGKHPGQFLRGRMMVTEQQDLLPFGHDGRDKRGHSTHLRMITHVGPEFADRLHVTRRHDLFSCRELRQTPICLVDLVVEVLPANTKLGVIRPVRAACDQILEQAQGPVHPQDELDLCIRGVWNVGRPKLPLAKCLVLLREIADAVTNDEGFAWTHTPSSKFSIVRPPFSSDLPHAAALKFADVIRSRCELPRRN